MRGFVFASREMTCEVPREKGWDSMARSVMYFPGAGAEGVVYLCFRVRKTVAVASFGSRIWLAMRVYWAFRPGFEVSESVLERRVVRAASGGRGR